MLNKLLASTSVAALFAATAANAAVTGSLDVNVDYGAETAGMHSTFYQVNANGRLEFGITDDWNGWNGQLEAFGTQSTDGTNTWYGKNHDNSGLTTVGGALHLNTTVDDVTFGPFLMLENTTVGDAGFYRGCCGASGYDTGQNLYAEIGGEARWHVLPDLDVNAELGGLIHLDAPGRYGGGDCGALCHGFFAGGGVTWFFDNDTSVSGHFDWIGGKGQASGRPAMAETGLDYGATIAHQFEDSPFAAYVAYDGNAFATNGFCGGHYIQHDNVVSVGIKWFFNGDTLRSQHDSAGFTAPHFERMINQSQSLDDVGYPF